MDYRNHLLTCCAAYAEATGLSPARIGTLAQNQGAFFKRLGAGAGCTMDTYLKVLGWFSANWPAGATWPPEVSRPSQQQPVEDGEGHPRSEAGGNGPDGHAGEEQAKAAAAA